MKPADMLFGAYKLSDDDPPGAAAACQGVIVEQGTSCCGRSARNEQPKLSDEEWALVIELLQLEQHELPAEIRHARVASFREDLRHRAAVINGLLERWETATA